MRHFILERVSPAPIAPPRGPLVHTSHKLDVKLFWGLPLLVWDLTFNTQQQLFCDNLSPGRTLGLSRLRVRPGMYETDRRLDWEEFLQERATATLKRSITLLQLRVLRLPREWSGLWPWVPATLPRRGSGGGSGSIRNRLSSSPTVLPTRSSRPQLIPDVLRTAMMCGRRKPRELLSQWFKTPVRFLPGVFSNSHRCSCPISVRTSSLLARASAS